MIRPHSVIPACLQQAAEKLRLSVTDEAPIELSRSSWLLPQVHLIGLSRWRVRALPSAVRSCYGLHEIAYPPQVVDRRREGEEPANPPDARSLTLRNNPIVFNQPKISSTHLRFRWLAPYPGCRVVRPSITLARFAVCWATCGVTRISRRLWINSWEA